MDNFPFATSAGPNVASADSPAPVDLGEEREQLSILRLNGFNHDVPLRWKGNTNELIHAINSYRRDQDIGIQEKLRLILYGCSEEQWFAFTCETIYIMQECGLSHFKCSQKIVKRGIDLTVDEYLVDADGKPYSVERQLRFTLVVKPTKFYVKV